MDLDQFWQIVDAADTPEALHTALAALDEPDLIAFEWHHEAATSRAYHWDLWGAAYVMAGGCGDDSFDYFRAYLISRGRAVYEAALADADSLAAVDDFDSEGEEWEDWMSPAAYAVEKRTGVWEFAGPPDPTRSPGAGEIGGEAWEEDDLAARLPRLAERYDS